MIYVGTSGFSYAEWKGTFYPEELDRRDYLSFYAKHFWTTEINNTFYRSPSESTAANWARQVPEEFRFTLKANRKITHHRKLENADREMEWFLKGAGALGGKLGTVLIQLPPYFRKKVEVLKSFLEKYAERVALALEFRHPSWFDEEIFELLESYRSALVLVEWDESEAIRVVTAPLIYVRLRKSTYSKSELENWAQWIASQEKQAFVYFKHGERAPEFAHQFVDAVKDS